MKQLICFAFVILHASIFVKANGYYTIVAPGTIQSNTDYAVTVTVHEHHEPATIQVGISGPSFNETKTIEIQPNSAEIVHFQLPSIEDGTYELKAEGNHGLYFKHYSKLNYEHISPNVYIQTDKALYKPGELVQYRILALDQNTKPSKATEQLTLLIKDGEKNKIKHIKDMKFIKGVYSGKFQLSEQPVFGAWSISVTEGKEQKQKAKKQFEVAKYVLPKFSVSIETDKAVAILDKVVKVTIRSKYTHSQPVKGTATVTASIASNRYPGNANAAVKSVDIDGKGQVEFSLMDDLDLEQSVRMPHINILAVVNETYTGLQQNSSTTVSVEQSRYSINVPNSPHDYEINKPFEIKAFIKKINGLPVTNARSTAKLIMTSTPINNAPGSGYIGYGGVSAGYQPNIGYSSYPGVVSSSYPGVGSGPYPGAGSGSYTGVVSSPFPGVGSGSYPGVSSRSNPGFSHDPGFSHRPGLNYDSSWSYSTGNDLMFETEVDQNGLATFQLKFKSPAQFSNVKVIFEEKTEGINGFRVKEANQQQWTSGPIGAIQYPQTGFIGENNYRQPGYDGPLKLFPLTNKPQQGEEIIINVKSGDPLPYFIYTVMAHGKIVQHEYVKVEAGKNSHTLKIKPVFEMAPEIQIFVYNIHDGDLKSDETTINIENKFINKLELTSPEETKPSEMVTLKIKTDPDSFVGLLAVDQSVLLLKSGNDFNTETMLKDLNNYDYDAPESNGRHNSWPGKKSGFLTITNACYPRQSNNRYGEPIVTRGYAGAGLGSAQQYSGSVGSAFPHSAMPASGIQMSMAQHIRPAASMPAPVIRKNFVESWIFDNVESTDSNGITSFTKKVPDTITSWVITGFSLNENTGFGMTENSTKIRVFQPFFVSLNLPYSVKRGEVIAIPVVIFNYMEQNLEAEITMDNTDDEYSFAEAQTDLEESINNEKKMSKTISVPSNGGATVSFMIKPRIVGEITLKIKAITALAGDEVHQKLKVEPEGVTHYKNEAFFIALPVNSEAIKHEFKADIPADIVVNSEFIEFAAVKDILAPTIENIDNLVRMPYGCGEQNMINFVPNILVLHYLDAMKMENASIVDKAKSYMEKGYQRELTYKHRDGSYSTFGEGRSQSSSWLTAYVARSFIQARKYITIDESIIEEALHYLISIQKSNGQFSQNGYQPHTLNEVGTTAFIVLAFVEDKDYTTKYKPQIEKAYQYLLENVEREDDVFTLALMSLVFQKLNPKHPQTARLLERLELKSYSENHLKWWSKSSQYQNNKIEITSYTLQTLLETETDHSKLLPIIKWLVKQRNNLGGFSSTQDTVVGLQALIKFAEKYAAGGSGKINIKYEAHNGDGKETTNGAMTLNKEDGLDLIAHEFTKDTRQLTITAEGEGNALVQFSYRYNLVAHDDNPSFVLKHTHKPELFPGHLLMDVCAEYKSQADAEINESNMVIMEIDLPSGYTTHSDNLKPIEELGQVQRVETKNSDTQIVIYFDSLVANQPICVNVFAERTHGVAKLKPVAITVYDYYNPEQRATIFYEVKSSLCDICEDEQCGKGCKTQ